MTALETIYLFPGVVSQGFCIPRFKCWRDLWDTRVPVKIFSIFMDRGCSYSRSKGCSKASLSEGIKGWQRSLIRKINSTAQTSSKLQFLKREDPEQQEAQIFSRTNSPIHQHHHKTKTPSSCFAQGSPFGKGQISSSLVLS